jgi:hypothetical protein
MPAAETDIRTEHAARYLARLCGHAGKMSMAGHRVGHRRPSHAPGDLPPEVRRVECCETEGTVSLNWGQWIMRAGPGLLAVRAEAADEESLRRIQELLTARLHKLGRRERLTVNWRRPEATDPEAEARATVRSEDLLELQLPQRSRSLRSRDGRLQLYPVAVSRQPLGERVQPALITAREHRARAARDHRPRDQATDIASGPVQHDPSGHTITEARSFAVQTDADCQRVRVQRLRRGHAAVLPVTRHVYRVALSSRWRCPATAPRRPVRESACCPRPGRTRRSTSRST